jgi:hypothetical protein
MLTTPAWVSLASAAGMQAIHACDQAAASPIDGDRPGGLFGIAIERIDVRSARQACEAALAATPNDKRLLFEYARVLEADKDQIAAAKFYAGSARLGYAAAQYALGVFYNEGYGGLAKSDRDAATWFVRGAQHGNAIAQLWLGEFYEYGRGGLARDLKEATRWYERAAAQGAPDAQRRVNYLRGSFAIRQPGGEAKQKQESAEEETVQAAEAQQKEVDRQTTRDQQERAWDALPEDERQRRLVAQMRRQHQLVEAQQACVAKCQPVEAECHQHNENRGWGIAAMNGLNMSSLMMSGIAADDCASALRRCVSQCEDQ